MEKRGYIHPDWTPDEDEDAGQKTATTKSIEDLDDNLTKKLSDELSKRTRDKAPKK